MPLAEINNITLNLQRIYIVENRVNYLIYPKEDNSIVIWGRGRAVTLLKGINFFTGIDIFYWGDIDPTGFEILDSLRVYYPQVKSMLMDRTTLNEYSRFVTTIKGFNPISLPNLTQEELEVYSSLFKDGYQLRLEQENVRIV